MLIYDSANQFEGAIVKIEDIIVKKTHLAHVRAGKKTVRKYLSEKSIERAEGYQECLNDFLLELDLILPNCNNFDELHSAMREVSTKKHEILFAFDDAFDALEKEKKKNITIPKI